MKRPEIGYNPTRFKPGRFALPASSRLDFLLTYFVLTNSPCGTCVLLPFFAGGRRRTVKGCQLIPAREKSWKTACSQLRALDPDSISEPAPALRGPTPSLLGRLEEEIPAKWLRTVERIYAEENAA